VISLHAAPAERYSPAMSDPRLQQLRSILIRRPALRLDRPPDSRDAAVALVLRARHELELLMIQRAEHEHDPWSGHMALPGGRNDPADVDLFATACRETEEETAVPLARVGTLLGGLDEIAPGTPRLPRVVIAPFVAAVPAETEAYPASGEVARTIWVPLAGLRDPRAVSRLLVELSDETLEFPSLNYQGHVIWGLTHRILTQFLEIVEGAGL
jgi:8-oxo-dGTP pyrophosphatase MutT (NUDIX family)